MTKFSKLTSETFLVHLAYLKREHLSLCSWYFLESKPGKKKKERGRIEVSIQFMRNNMTASMFDLSMKEKPRSPFSKLKDKMKGRKHDGGFGDASSAILPPSAMCDSESNSVPKPQAQPEAKVRRPLLAGTHKLSAAHSMSDLIGTHFRPKLDSMNSIEESGEFNMSSVVIVIIEYAEQFKIQRMDHQGQL